MNHQDAFAPDYATARLRFRQAAVRLEWKLEAHPLGVQGPQGEELVIDVAQSPGSDLGKVLVVSSGVHGVEGFLGSAVQVALLDRWVTEPAPEVRCLFLHGLNPYAFAWLRRVDENNIDPNRNFLLTGERYEGSPPGYAALDSLLNPQNPPSPWEPFTLKAMLAIARYGMPALQQAVAAGQYDYPRGLFFGGSEPGGMHRFLAEHMPRWLEGSEQVIHMDFHTGLGSMGACKLLIDYPLSDLQRAKLADWFGADSFEACESSGIAYDARGGFGRWCNSRKLAPDYLFACAEFGTYSPVRVLAGLRAENQAQHWGSPSDPSTVRARQRLKELFCPASEDWRSQCLKRGMDLVERAHRGLAGGQ